MIASPCLACGHRADRHSDEDGCTEPILAQGVGLAPCGCRILSLPGAATGVGPADLHFVQNDRMTRIEQAIGALLAGLVRTESVLESIVAGMVEAGIRPIPRNGDGRHMPAVPVPEGQEPTGDTGD